jgi:2-keto-4-pentenoate hydratase/2-oxohepta-3-ene-1,7-dioic acid hydratase in catechol pathway
VRFTGQIVCLARSFRLHAEELGNAVPESPLYFLKSSSAVIGDGDTIVLPPESALVHHEGEVAVEVGARLRRASADAAARAIAGWTVLNDVTARDLQKADNGRFTRAKGFDTFCPLSATRVPALPWRDCRVQCAVNGEVRQDGALRDLLWTPGEILAAVSAVMTLWPGDLVSLGTPAGVGPLVDGDEVEVRLVGPDGGVLARVRNPVRREAPIRQAPPADPNLS